MFLQKLAVRLFVCSVAKRKFIGTLEDFGISPSSHVVMCVLFVCCVNRADFIPNDSYDTHGIFSSPRALFMFRSFGHHRSSILNGGLPAWEAHGFPLESGKHSRGDKGSYPPPKLNEGVIRGEHRCPTDT